MNNEDGEAIDGLEVLNDIAEYVSFVDKDILGVGSYLVLLNLINSVFLFFNSLLVLINSIFSLFNSLIWYVRLFNLGLHVLL